MNFYASFFVGYGLTVTIETAVLLVGLSPRHALGHRLFAGIWLTACTYPVVVFVLPVFWDIQTERTLYLIVAETFAPVAECLIFWIAFRESNPRSSWALVRDSVAIVGANLASFGIGEWMNQTGAWNLLFGSGL